MVSNWSRMRLCVAGVVDNSSTVPTTAKRISRQSECIRKRGFLATQKLTFEFTAKNNIDALKDLDRLRNGLGALTLRSAVASYGTYSFSPPVFLPPSALTLVD